MSMGQTLNDFSFSLTINQRDIIWICDLGAVCKIGMVL
jgi:hypothetical protein